MPKYTVVDHETNNILGEYPTRDQAENLRARLVEADSRADADLEVHVVTLGEVDEIASVVAFDRAAG